MREFSGKTRSMETKRDRKLKVMYTNAGQFLNKRDDLAAGDEPNIMIITEVIPKAQINLIGAPLLELESYDVHANCATDLGASGINIRER